MTILWHPQHVFHFRRCLFKGANRLGFLNFEILFPFIIPKMVFYSLLGALGVYVRMYRWQLFLSRKNGKKSLVTFEKQIKERETMNECAKKNCSFIDFCVNPQRMPIYYWQTTKSYFVVLMSKWVNFANIVLSAFCPISFCQKNTNT